MLDLYPLWLSQGTVGGTETGTRIVDSIEIELDEPVVAVVQHGPVVVIEEGEDIEMDSGIDVEIEDDEITGKVC